MFSFFSRPHYCLKTACRISLVPSHTSLLCVCNLLVSAGNQRTTLFHDEKNYERYPKRLKGNQLSDCLRCYAFVFDDQSSASTVRNRRFFPGNNTLVLTLADRPSIRSRILLAISWLSSPDTEINSHSFARSQIFSGQCAGKSEDC